MRGRGAVLALVLAVGAAGALFVSGVSGAAAFRLGSDAREVVASTAPVPAQSSVLSVMPLTSRVRVSVFVGRDRAGLAAAARAVSDPSSRRYEHYLSPAHVQADYGVTAAGQRAVSGWLTRAGLMVTYHDGFVVSATGTVAQAESALHARLELSHPARGADRVVPTRAMTVPRPVAALISTVQVAPGNVPAGRHYPVTTPAAGVTEPRAAMSVREECSRYYGQKKASALPGAYGQTLTWAPCGYLSQQLRHAYGAAQAGLTGAGVSVAILSEDHDATILSDANRWARDRGVPPFAPGQFSDDIAPHVFPSDGDPEDALDIEAVHGIAPAAQVSEVAGNGSITGNRLLDSLDTVVTYRIADVVSSSFLNTYMPVPTSMIDAWESVLERAAVEGITVDFASGDWAATRPLTYPTSDPWVTSVGGTSLAIGARGSYLWETPWEDDGTGLGHHGTAWTPPPPGRFTEGSTGGLSTRFTEPYYQRGVVTGNLRNGKAMRALPDVSALADPDLGYQVGLTLPIGHHRHKYFNSIGGGTSLAAPLFAGLEADLIQGRRGIPLGFANPALYDHAFTSTFHQLTSHPQGQGVTEAVVDGPAYQLPPFLSTMGQCASTPPLTCGPGYSTSAGIGSPGLAFFRSFGSRPR